MDIVKFIRSQRIAKICMFSLLTDDQRKFARRLAESVLPASSNSSESDNKETDYSYVRAVIDADDSVGN